MLSRPFWLIVLSLVSCAPQISEEPVLLQPPEAADWGPLHGPGLAHAPFAEEDRFINCAYLTGGPEDTTQHHNLVVPFNGYVLMPWAPEWSRGGISLFDLSEPCAPVNVATTVSEDMRETHSTGFSKVGGQWIQVVNGMRTFDEGGIQLWDLTDPLAPTPVSSLNLPGYLYPDAYARLTLSVFYQAPYIYVAGADNGVYIVDASDPLAPVLVNTYEFSPTLRAGQVQAIGDLLVVTAAEGSRSVLLDISDPVAPQPIPGGDFDMTDEEGTPREAYFTNVYGGNLYYARKEGGGGVVVYDIKDPTTPTRLGGYRSEGNGGYVFVQDDYAFVGESSFSAIYDVSDPSQITEVGRLDLEGDLDTLTPIGSLAFVSVDDKGNPDQGTAVAPWQLESDSIPPHVLWSWPQPDGLLAPTSRIGLMFNEMIEPVSVFEGSVRLWRVEEGEPVEVVPTHLSIQETLVSIAPVSPLVPGGVYEVEVPEGGLIDPSGNPIREAFRSRLTVAGVSGE